MEEKKNSISPETTIRRALTPLPDPPRSAADMSDSSAVEDTSDSSADERIRLLCGRKLLDIVYVYEAEFTALKIM
jgi:hypothetical protein